MNNNYQRLQQWLRQRTLREQWILLVLGLVIEFGLWNYCVEAPVINTINALTKNIIVLTAEHDQLQKQLNSINTILHSEPIVDLLNKQRQIEQQYQAVERSSFVSIKNLAALVTDIYKLNKNIEIINYNLQEFTPWKPSGVQDNILLKKPIYKYTIQLKLHGDYFDTLAFMKKMEALHWSIYLENFNYKVDKYPMAEITTQFYVLSRD